MCLLYLGALVAAASMANADGEGPPLAVAPFDAKAARGHQEAWAKHLGIPVFTTNKIGMKLALVPPGEFIMGSPRREPERGGDETPHKVRLTKPYRISVHEVTLGQFEEFVKDTGYQTAAENKKLSKMWKDAFAEQKPTWPVVRVTWNDAARFCEWLSKKEGRTYRLPTEAEWEYACRAGTQTAFHYGEDLTSDRANFNGFFPHPFGQGKKGPSRGQPTPVGSFAANAFGLFDMHGNVWEFCADWYGAYPKGEAADPTGPPKGHDRVVRSGCYEAFGRNCRSADREAIGPDDSSIRTGFRVVTTDSDK
jgi:formylglycine-generating enzyme required for sulfatase activity